MRAALLASMLAGAPALAAEGAYSWVQHVPGGVEARTVVEAGTCPTARVDDLDAAMRVRAEPGPDYPVLVCALTLPPGTRSASVGGAPLALPAAEPRRILVVADTGCRIKGELAQACNDPAQWPFRAIAERAAATRPDLVIHLGDFHYRETPCPAGNAGCAGSPHGDTWPAWRADFFDPAAALLPVAPWVVVRGNHEECGRGGLGWTRALDPRPFDAGLPCTGVAEPYAVRLPGLTLAVMDVSTADERRASDPQVQGFRRQFEAVGRAVGASPAWLVLHRPIWSAEGMRDGLPFGGNRTLAAAAAGGAIPAGVSMLLSGHHHTFQVFNYEAGAGLPPQVVAGHGGDQAHDGTPPDPAGLVIDGVRVASGMNQAGYGFLLLERDAAGPGWTAVSHDVAGRPGRSCAIGERLVRCGAMAGN